MPAPIQSFLNQDSIVYSAGVGEDISFDLNLHYKTGCKIYLIDPTARAKAHFEEVKSFYSGDRSQPSFRGAIQSDYIENIRNLSIDIEKFEFIPIGLGNQPEQLKFYRQIQPDYVSQSLIQGMFGDDYDLVTVDSLSGLMRQNGDTQIDLLKLDIEGAEIKVLNDIIDRNIMPKIICVEFDLFIKGKDKNSDTQKIVERLACCNYRVISNQSLNITFLHVS